MFVYFAAALVLAIVLFFGSFYVLWIFFLGVTNISQAGAEGTLTPTAKKLGWPIIFVGTWLDYFVQYVPATLLFFELPREPMLSGRVARLIATGSGWRQRLAVWFRDTLLKPFDRSGAHG